MTDEKFERAVEALDEMGFQAAAPSLSRRLAPSDPVGSLAADLCETAICEAMPPEEIERTALACRKAAETCYGRYPHESIDPAFNESFDAQVWAHAFVQIYRANPSIANDEGTMAGWFANALMRGFDEHARRVERGGIDPNGQPDRGLIDPGVEGEPPAVPFRAFYDFEPVPPPPAAVEGAQAAIQGDLSGGPFDIYAPAAHVSFTLDEAALRRHDGSEGGDR